ncbi:MAG: lamin tail domain-containing protein [Pirellulales bacterium]
MRLFPRRRPSKPSRHTPRFRTETLEPRLVLDGAIISELLAVNDNGIVDEDGERGDWIELLNTGTADENLSGWQLRDSGTTWPIPNVTLTAGESLLVWATNKDRRDPDGELHTNFRLTSSGEYLGLLRPDDSVAFEFAPSFPPQVPDVSYGVPTVVTTTTLIADGASVRLLVPTDGSLDAPAPNETPPWTQPLFDDSTWTTAAQGVGYETDASDPPPQPLIANAATEFSRFQGLNGWRYGYWNRGDDANGVFDAATTDFTQFSWVGQTVLNQGNHWDGTRWSLAGQTQPKTTELNATGGIPSGGTFVHAAVRRWTAEVSGAIRIRGELADLDPAGDGVVASILVNGVEVYRQAINGNSLNYTAYTSVNQGDRVDFMIDSGANDDGVGDATRFTIEIEHLTELPPPNLASSIGGDAASNLESQMLGAASSAYLRIPFNVADASAFEFLKLNLKYDAGFVAYLNGVEVARANAPGEPVYNSEALLERADVDAIAFSEINLSSRLGILTNGPNVLAIHGINSDPTNSDFLISATLAGSTLTVDTSTPKYFVAPTPRNPNGLGTTDVGPVVAGVTHTPNVPQDNENLVVTAYVAATFDAVAAVELRYRVMYGSEVTLPMFDDGLHGDGAAGDLVYGASISASASSPGQMIRYYVRAVDATSDVTRIPLPDNPNDPEVYEDYRGTMVHDPSVNSDLPVYYWFVPNAGTATGGSVTYGSLFYNGELYDNVRTDQHGQSTGGFAKKSFDVDFPNDHRFTLSPDLPKMKDINWLSNWADRTKTRNTLSYETFKEAGSAYHLAFPIRIQQNGQFFSIADFVEDGDDRFLERLGRNPDGALYKIYSTFTDVAPQEKKSRRWESGKADLQAFLNGVNQSGTALTNFLYDNVNIPTTITYLAGLAITENTDCCHKNHYLYRDVPVDEGGTGEWEAMPWDVDLSFGHTWNRPSGSSYLGQDLVFDDNIGTGGNNNFMSKLFANPQINQMYLRRIRTLMDEILQPPGTPNSSSNLVQRIEELKTLLGYNNYSTQQFNNPAGSPPNPSLPHDANLDRNRWLAWGSDQDPSPTVSTQEWTTQIQRLIDEYLPNRRNFLYSLGTIPAAQPANANVSIVAHDARPASGDQDQEYIEIRNANAYAVDISDWTVSGDIDHTFTKGTVIAANTSLFLTPWSPAFRARTVDPKGNEGRFIQGGYEGHLSARGGTVEIRDKTGRLAMAAPYTFGSIATPEQNYLRISEIMYNPATGTSGLYASDEYEFIELTNTGPTALNLTGVHFTEGVAFDFTGSAVTSLAAGQSVLIVKNPAAFAERYDTTGLLIAGAYTGQLDNSGERLRLEDSFNEMILDFDYEDDWEPVTDGSGFSLNVIDTTVDFHLWDSKVSWRPSQNQHGSPGTTDTYTLPPAGSVVINEVLANTTAATGDWIELHNTTTGAIDIGGWWLSDDTSSLQQAKYQIPAGTILGSGEYLVFNSRDHFGPTANPANPFGLSSLGDEVVLTAGTVGGPLNGYQDVRNFAASDAGVSFGRYTNSVGDVFFPAMASLTVGASNSQPLVGPVVISEIMYNPPAGGAEFIELFNRSAQPVPLFDPANPAAAWRFSAGVEFSFPPGDGSNGQYPAGVTLAAGERLIVVEGDPEAFRTSRGLPASLKIFSFAFGNLDNGGERVELVKPSPQSGGSIGYVVVDRVDYDDAAPWPLEADGLNSAMGRLVSGSYANDPTNWRSTNLGGTPGSPNIFLDISPPTTPTNLAAAVAGPTRIDLVWTASNDPETGIERYNIYRDDLLYNSSVEATFSDTAALPGVSYSYRVSAVNGGGTEGALSASTPGTIILSIQSASAPLENRVRVVFSETVQAATASNAANFAIDGGIAVLAASLSADNRSVLLTTTALASGQAYHVAATNIVGVSGRAIAPNSSVEVVLSNIRQDFSVRHVNKAGGAVTSLEDADALLALPSGNPGIASQASGFYPTVNFRDDDGVSTSGYFGGDDAFPANTTGDNDDFAIRATTTVTVPANAAGAWTFAVGIRPEPVIAIPVGATWRYLDNGSDQGTAWTASGYNDTPGQNGWQQGAAQLGYGDDDETTTVDDGGDPENRYVTTYFRKSFDVANPAAIVSMTARVLRDDGVALYLNGVEIARNNLAPGAAFDTLASATVSGADETVFNTFGNLSLASLVAGTNVLAVEVHQAALNSSDISFDLELLLSTTAPPPAPTVTTIVPTGASWNYLDNGSNQGLPANGAAWFGHPNYDDSTWASGPAQLGYGDGDEATVVGFGGNAANKFVTTYFRRQFNVADPSLFAKLSVDILRDDGAAVYLNGFEIVRTNLDPGAAYDTRANTTVSGAEETTQFNFFDNIDASLLVAGTNTLAVEIHQVALDSSDISFDMRLDGYSRAADDGVRLRIDGQDVIVAGTGNSAADRFGTVNLSAGAHDVDLVYFERDAGAQLELFAASGTRSFFSTDFKLVGDVANGGLAVSTTGTPPNQPPVVTDVLVSGSTWTAGYLAELAAAGLGDGGASLVGRPTTGAAGALHSTSLDQIKIRFGDDVAPSQSHLNVFGVNVADYAATVGFAPGGFSYDAATRTATWTFNEPFRTDVLRVVLDDALTDVGGAALDGEWTDGVSTFSGDGSPGGDLRVRFDVLPGDLDASGQTSLADVHFGRPAQFSGVGHPIYDPALDVDGNGLLNIVDLTLVRNFQGSTLPGGTPGGAPAAAAGAVVASRRVADVDRAVDAAHAALDDNAARMLTARSRTRDIARSRQAGRQTATDAALSAIDGDATVSRSSLRRLLSRTTSSRAR